MGGFGLADRTDPSNLRQFFPYSFSQLFHNILKDLRMKQLPENLFFGIRLRPQKLHKLSLCVVILVISDPIKEDRGRLRKRKKYLYVCQTGGNILRRKRMPDW